MVWTVNLTAVAVSGFLLSLAYAVATGALFMTMAATI